MDTQNGLDTTSASARGAATQAANGMAAATALCTASDETLINLIIAVQSRALAAINGSGAANARSQAIAHPRSLHPRSFGATLIGMPESCRVNAAWAAWANTIAARLGTCSADSRGQDTRTEGARTESSRLEGTTPSTIDPADVVPAILAVAQQCGRSGEALLRGIARALARLPAGEAGSAAATPVEASHNLSLAITEGIGACLELDDTLIDQALRHAHHASFTTARPDADSGNTTAHTDDHRIAHAGKLAIEAVDQAMRGEPAPATGAAAASWPQHRPADASDGAEQAGALPLSNSPFASNPFARDPLSSSQLASSPLAALPRSRMATVQHFRELAEPLVSAAEQTRFLDTVQRLSTLPPGSLTALGLHADQAELRYTEPDGRGIF